MKLPILFTLFFLAKQSCGIIGGKPASPYDWPSLVLIKYYSEHYCGGTFFLPNWVMTAAHCVSEKILGVNMIQGVGVGIYDLNSFEGQIVPMEFLDVHPGFAMEGAHSINDVAVLRLPLKVPMTSMVHPLPITRRTEEMANTSCKAAGWGMSSINIYTNNVTDPSEVFRSDRILYEVDQVIVDLEYCKEVDIFSSKLELSDEYHICARSGFERSGPSFGDIGGPLICNGEQVGIASLTMYNPKVSTFLFVVYTKISVHRVWAERIVMANPAPAETTPMTRPSSKKPTKNKTARSTKKDDGKVKNADDADTRSKGKKMRNDFGLVVIFMLIIWFQ